MEMKKDGRRAAHKMEKTLEQLIDIRILKRLRDDLRIEHGYNNDPEDDTNEIILYLGEEQLCSLTIN